MISCYFAKLMSALFSGLKFMQRDFSRTLDDKNVRSLSVLRSALEDLYGVARAGAADTSSRSKCVGYLKSIRQETVATPTSSPATATLVEASCVGIALAAAWGDVELFVSCISTASLLSSVMCRDFVSKDMGAEFLSVMAQHKSDSFSFTDLVAYASVMHAAFVDPLTVAHRVANCPTSAVDVASLIVAQDLPALMLWCNSGSDAHPLLTALLRLLITLSWKRLWIDEGVAAAFRLQSLDEASLPLPPGMLARFKV